MSNQRGATVVVKASSGLTLERPVFELVESGGRKHRFDATTVRIGAGPGNDLILDRPTVSSVHAELVATSRGLRLRDLGSTNGTTVAGVRVFDALVEDGATIAVGDVALTLRMGKDTVAQPLSDKTELNGAVGASPAMRAVFSRLERVAKTDATVLIHGETGTGKEVVAWSLYEASRRKDQPFVVLDCGSIARTLIESELFGHEKGAFTGADKRRIGAFERAQGGTLFLDELGELDLELQPKLLRALERREIQRLGGDKPMAVDVRIIAATHRDLRTMVARGEFREDLYYRLAVVTLELPPLRERREDVPLLVDHFLKALGADRAALPAGAIERFVEHDWPGNARELKNAVERAVVLGETRLQTSPRAAAALSGTPSGATSGATTSSPPAPAGSFVIDPSQPYKDQKAAVIADFEERYARLLMKLHQGNVSAAARVAGIDRMSLHKILDRYGLDARDLGRGE
ncbi:MAG: sigma 54-dependent Fis family transcriptional regulator [Deltaproteobacteria bacterium]|nr:sigma 54-dependent Fis family transcriptional regulator [Deltaproteobacteria bacterium]